MSFFAYLIVLLLIGLIAGALGRLALPGRDPMSIPMTIAIGIGGSLIGGIIGRLLFGPDAAAARLESSKAFAKAFMARHGVPTARFRVCESLDQALESVRRGEFGVRRREQP